MAGWPECELSAMDVAPDPSAWPQTGFIILRGIDTPLPTAIPVLVGAFQHLVQRDLPVGLLVIGTIRGIKALHNNPPMSSISRAESVIQS